MSSKRPRSSSPSSSHRSASSPPSPSSKLSKTIPDVLYTSRTCTLPPTCSYPRASTPLSSAHEVEEHYAKYHTFVCEHERCMGVFPDARFLELHFAECHDPITALKKEQGEKIFACYLATCPRLFVSPKGRRLHLIQSHGYPKQFFFAVTNKGIGGLLHKWGQGASLYRGDWRSRIQDHDMKSESESGHENRSESGSEMDVEDRAEHEINGKKHKPPQIEGSGDDSLGYAVETLSTPRNVLSTTPARPREHGSPESDTLANAMSSLSLVPDKIRFGRGGKKGGFAHSRPAKSTHTARGGHSETGPDTIVETGGDEKCFKGRGGGRRRAQGVVASEGTRNPDAGAPVQRAF